MISQSGASPNIPLFDQLGLLACLQVTFDMDLKIFDFSYLVRESRNYSSRESLISRIHRDLEYTREIESRINTMIAQISMLSINHCTS